MHISLGPSVDLVIFFPPSFGATQAGNVRHQFFFSSTQIFDLLSGPRHSILFPMYPLPKEPLMTWSDCWTPSQISMLTPRTERHLVRRKRLVTWNCGMSIFDIVRLDISLGTVLCPGVLSHN